jgi:hypothetical protein
MVFSLYGENQTNDDYFRREVYIGVIDQISQKLDNLFDKVNMEFLSCLTSLVLLIHLLL